MTRLPDYPITKFPDASIRSRLEASGLSDIAEKLDAGERLALEDGVRLFDTPDLLAVGWLANREREKRHGARTYYNYNIRLEATNVCVASCLFCSFARLKPGDPGAYTMSLEEAWDKLRQRSHQPLTEVHVVNGLHPDLPFSYYTELLRGLQADPPGHSPEVLHRRRDRVLCRSLRHDRRAGAARVDGGGTRFTARRRRRDLRRARAPQDRARQVRHAIAISTIHRTAHRLGMRSNVTMLYGHIETNEERVDHMLRARALQDETGGFQAFIPLAFHPDNNQMRKLPAPTAADTLRVHAVARLMLDNIPHVKAFWIATGVEVAQTALWFGADDLDGTVQEEKIYHMAGSRTPESMTTQADPAADHRRRPRAARARHALQRRLTHAQLI